MIPRPPPIKGRRPTLPTAFIVTAILAFVYAQSAIGLGIARQLEGPMAAFMGLGALCTAAGLIAALLKRPPFAWAAWALAVVILAGITAREEMRISQMRSAAAPKVIAESEAALAEALARVPCTNGDIAILQMLNNTGTDRYSMSISIVHRNRAETPSLLVDRKSTRLNSSH